MGNDTNLEDRVATIVAAALQRPPNERESYVHLACEGDGELLREVTEALDWEQRMGDFLQEPAMLPEETPLPSAAMAGAIGPYRLLQKVGEGGMAEGWQAQQTPPPPPPPPLKPLQPPPATHTL